MFDFGELVWVGGEYVIVDGDDCVGDLVGLFV